MTSPGYLTSFLYKIILVLFWHTLETLICVVITTYLQKKIIFRALLPLEYAHQRFNINSNKYSHLRPQLSKIKQMTQLNLKKFYK
jgi:hypothetical protein